MYVVLEGIDTAGKSTQIELLKELHPNALITKEPGGTPFGEQIREIVLHKDGLDGLTELLLFLSDRREHYVKKVQPALEKKQWVISDRSLISGVSYACVNQTKSLYELIDLNLMVLDQKLPNGVILFDIPKATLIERLGMKSHDSIEKRGIDYLLEVQQTLIQTTKELNIPHIIVDASLDIQTIHKKIQHFIEQLEGTL